MARLPLAALAALLGLVPTAFAQGSDLCGTPTVVSGLGTFPYSTTTATTGSEGQPGCGGGGMFRDVWFTWTATATDQFTLSSCGLASWDTAYAVYAGAGCPTSPALGCNDDSCGLQTRVIFSAVSGNSYTFQLASYSSGGAGSGSFQISQGGPPGCSPALGPDVIVGDVSDVNNYNPLAGIDAFALGTTSCNMGNAPLNWFASTNQHPVIGCNLYRYKVVDGAGRFEQVGMSWLKHGFAALSGSLCCPCQGGGGSQLGVGCSDPYSAGLNGSQSGLGPRWQVDAHTGFFTYPPANPPWSGSTARRIEVALADLEVTTGSSTRYFGECQYVTPDDAAAGNQNNNSSWREMTVTGSASNYNLNLISVTQRTQPAIRVWAQIDPEVVLTDVQVPNDGLFIVGSRSYDMGGGIWRYEYSAYNMNSHRSGGTFRVPVPQGATVTNAGFNSVIYRNGDGPGNTNMSSAPWTFSHSGGFATWATETEAQNNRANALRWGTTYSFRFDCDSPPANGSLVLGLWRSGSPGTELVDARVPANSGPTAFCLGDGSGEACPCGNVGTFGGGCLNSLGMSGYLAGTGTASVASDTFVLNGSGMPDSAVLYYQGTIALAGVPFGDGLRCAGGQTTRLGTKQNVGSFSIYPAAGDAPISVQGACAPGDTRAYQAWYRNSAAFCTADTFNLTNGYQVVWLP